MSNDMALYQLIRPGSLPGLTLRASRFRSKSSSGRPGPRGELSAFALRRFALGLRRDMRRSRLVAGYKKRTKHTTVVYKVKYQEYRRYFASDT